MPCILKKNKIKKIWFTNLIQLRRAVEELYECFFPVYFLGNRYKYNPFFLLEFFDFSMSLFLDGIIGNIFLAGISESKPRSIE